MKKLTAGLAGLVLAAVPFVASGSAVATGHGESERSCARNFDRAQRMDMESFRDYDRKTFRDGHTKDAVTIFASGELVSGVDNILQALDSHFTNRQGVWAWTELSRRIEGCESAYIIYEATYDLPSGYHERTLTQVSYVYKHGKWLAVLDQGTYLGTPG